MLLNNGSSNRWLIIIPFSFLQFWVQDPASLVRVSSRAASGAHIAVKFGLAKQGETGGCWECRALHALCRQKEGGA